MRTLTALALLLAACGGAETTTEAPATEAHEGTEHAAEPAAEPAPAAATGDVTCDQFADHMLETMEAQIEAEGDNEFMTVAQQKEFATTMTDGIRGGCNNNNRLGEFPELVGCFMAANDQAAFEACKEQPKADEFDEYMKGLLASAMQLEPAAE